MLLRHDCDLNMGSLLPELGFSSDSVAGVWQASGSLLRAQRHIWSGHSPSFTPLGFREPAGISKSRNTKWQELVLPVRSSRSDCSWPTLGSVSL